jgi:hypothetical protein
MRLQRIFATLAIIPWLFAVGGCLGTAASKPPVAVEAPPAGAAPATAVTLPNEKGSLKFAVLGDFGTGKPPEYEVAAQMARLFGTFKLDLVVLAGDNLYGAEGPQDFKLK